MRIQHALADKAPSIAGFLHRRDGAHPAPAADDPAPGDVDERRASLARECAFATRLAQSGETRESASAHELIGAMAALTRALLHAARLPGKSSVDADQMSAWMSARLILGAELRRRMARPARQR
jgi:hypothetical protein